MKGSKLTWVNYPETVPQLNGYYYTHYFNHDENQEFCKCIYWDGGKWCPWRPGSKPELTVIEYAPETVEPYYSLCRMRQYEDEIGLSIMKDTK
jgi:hypothetical protein